MKFLNLVPWTLIAQWTNIILLVCIVYFLVKILKKYNKE